MLRFESGHAIFSTIPCGLRIGGYHCSLHLSHVLMLMRGTPPVYPTHSDHGAARFLQQGCHGSFYEKSLARKMMILDRMSEV
jgi:hypothetical protein